MGKVIFSISLLLSTFNAPARAAEAIGESQSYLGNLCEQLLFETGDGEIEAYFLERVNSPELMARLLRDYQIIQHPDFEKSILPALKSLGISFELLTSPNFGEMLGEVRKILSLVDGDFESIEKAFRQNMIQLKSVESSGRSANQARIETLRVERLLKTIDSNERSKKLFAQIISDTVKSAATKLLAIQIQQMREAFNRQGSLIDRHIPNGSALSLLLACGTGIYSSNIFFGIATFFVAYTCSASIDKINESWKFAKMEEMASEFSKSIEGTSFGLESHDVSAHRYLYTTPPTIFEILKKESKSGVLSVRNACNTELCKLNPVEIAYLGYIDLFEVQSIEQALRAAVQSEKRSEKLQAVNKFARLVLGSPNEFALQARLRREMSAWITEMKKFSDVRSSISADLVTKLKVLGAELRTIKNRAYQDDLEKASNEDLLKYELYLKKINGDLNTLLSLEAKVEEIDAWGNQLNQKVAKLELLMRDLPTDPRGWVKRAEEIISVSESW